MAEGQSKIDTAAQKATADTAQKKADEVNTTAVAKAVAAAWGPTVTKVQVQMQQICKRRSEMCRDAGKAANQSWQLCFASVLRPLASIFVQLQYLLL